MQLCHEGGLQQYFDEITLVSGHKVADAGGYHAENTLTLAGRVLEDAATKKWSQNQKYNAQLFPAQWNESAITGVINHLDNELCGGRMEGTLRTHLQGAMAEAGMATIDDSNYPGQPFRRGTLYALAMTQLSPSFVVAR
jgi:hypothetical protein